jgi:broad specificity phosphatase PhoE
VAIVRFHAFLFAAAFGAALPSWPAAPLVAASSALGRSIPSDTALVRALRAGGHVLACRHALTDWAGAPAGPQSLEDRATQRNLSDEGEAQARALGCELERLRIPVGEVLASPWARTMESAELTFGRVEASGALYEVDQEDDLRRLFTRPPGAGTNRALVTHQSVLRQIMPRFRRGEIEEGDCVVVRPDGEGGFTVRAHLSLADWTRLR